MQILAVNSGSSSVKFGLFKGVGFPGRDAPAAQRICFGEIDLSGSHRAWVRSRQGALLQDCIWPMPRTAQPSHASVESSPTGHGQAQDLMQAAIGWIIAELERLQRCDGQAPLRIDAVGHRIVMGGMHFDGPVRIDPVVFEALSAMVTLAPLHQPAGLAGVQAASQRLPDAIQVACLDTAFHRTQPWVSQAYALPRRFDEEGVRRYGFHGLSYAHLAARLETLYTATPPARVIGIHLGSGASMCAMRNGQSVATTMGFSALDGLPMSTRCGQIDPGVLLWLLQAQGWDPARLSDLLYRESGLKGLSGISGDMRELLQSKDPRAAQAIEYYVHHAQRALASMTATLAGVDAIVFTGGIGEHAPAIRARILENIGWMGVHLEPTLNDALQDEGRIDAADSKVAVWVIPADEQATIAREVMQVLQRPETSSQTTQAS
jgi:acetate kinase